MNILYRAITCRVIRQINRSITNFIPKQTKFVPQVVINNSVHIMSQRSITSFFKLTPATAAVKQEKIDNKEIEKENGSDTNSPPQSNGKVKASSKRPRLESSESDASPQKKQTSPVTTNTSTKKTKIKRQRIESSGSESESSPKSDQEIKQEPPEGEEDSKPAGKENVTKSVSLRTYSSPKTKKKSLQNNPSIKEKKTPPKRKQNESSIKDGRTEVKRSPSPVKLKTEEKGKIKSKSEEEQVEDSKSEVLVPEVEYDPSKSKYHPVKDACWRKGEPVPYLALARTLELIEGTSARLKIVEILSNYFRSVIALTPEDLLPTVYMCLNQLAPAYHSLELGIAETYLMKAIGQCTGRSVAQVRAAAHREGDLGRVAELARAAQRTMFTPAPLTARKVFAALRDIARMTGHASVNNKINKIQSLYVACRHSEARYLIRSLEGKLRIGLAEQSVLQALALATATTPPDPHGVKVLDASRGLSTEQFKARVDEHALIIKTTYCECPNYESIVEVILRHGVMALPQHCRLTPGVPLKPMLAHPTKGVSEIFDRFEKERFTCEWKYDGERAQIHVPGEERPQLDKAAIFSRNQENNTTKYPDVLRRLPELLKESVRSCVLDCEAVAYDTATEQILPFQVLSTRKRKDAAESEIKVQVCVFVFDLLYLNGRALVNEPLLHRRELLREHFRETPGSWQFATSKDCQGIEEVQQFLELSVKGSCEGLMVKALEGPNAKYDIARRSHNWLKLKKDYLEGVGDTIDAVVVGAYRGRGKRAGVFGGFLLACHDRATDEYQSLCKIGTGFSDADLAALSAQLQDHVIDAPRSYYRYDASHSADVWVSARCVWEVRCADLSLSPAHRAAQGLVHPDKGISLRFPRFVRVRDDKSPEQATSAQQIADMYLAQDQVKNTTNDNKSSIDDFY